MSTKEIKSTIGTQPGIGESAPRAPDVDPKQAVAPDPGGPVMTYEERRAAIRASIAEPEETEHPRTEEETEAIIDQHMAREHLAGPVPEGKLFTVQAHNAKGQPNKDVVFPAMTHQEAIDKCKDLNDAHAENDGTWYGVTNAPIEAL